MLCHHQVTRHYRSIFLIFGPFLFEIVIVGCFLSENGTFGRPEAVLGDNATGYQKSGLSRSKRDVWSHYGWRPEPVARSGYIYNWVQNVEESRPFYRRDIRFFKAFVYDDFLMRTGVIIH
ncbi:hypothetical protein AVEN_269470-1 [Araneus ventricosus]|uniref:Uncharacterized protein n=1 Tax=Araneus ventricosus TaxID=182803 RepID=A0A4Y2BWJ1_ARAVE|nr:hypothetical protein AVEN_269470-1 [Araneus ventricosus]